MKVICWYSQHKREEQLARRMADGIRLRGDTAFLRVKNLDDPGEDCDLACIVGVKNLQMYQDYLARGVHVAYWDKGYIRRLWRDENGKEEWLDYWRVSVNMHQPLPFIEKAKKGPQRAREAGMELMPWRKHGEAIIVDGSSAKHYAFHDLGNPTDVAKRIVDELRMLTPRPIIYRPKPSWTGAVPIEGTEYSNGKDYRPAFARAHALVTYGSNLCYDAALAGVPSIVLGQGVARPISSTSLEEIENPRLATDAERQQWVSNVAWCQFKKEEMNNGVAWDTVKEMLACATA
jgi:hypothetical protein